MLKYILPLLFLLPLVGMAQDTLHHYVNYNGKPVVKSAALYQRTAYTTTNNQWTVLDYDMDGNLYRSGNYETDKLKTATGTHRYYYETGEVKSEGLYKDNMKSGEWTGYFKDGKTRYIIQFLKDEFHGPIIAYWDDGTKRREDQYKKGELIEGVCYNEKGNVIPHYNFEQMPEFPGGIDGLMNYLRENVRYPPEAKKNNIAGKVYITFVINTLGEIEQVEILRGVHSLLDKEAIRVVKKMPLWSPGIQHGDLVKVSYNLPINFVLTNHR